MPAQIKLPEQNVVFLVGRLTRDPNVSFTQKGQAVCRCDIAVNRRYLDTATNEWKDDTVFVPVVVWGAAAERCKDRVKKGTPISVEGRLTSSEYTDKTTGQTRRSLQVTARRIQILENNAAGGYHTADAAPAAKDDVPTTDVMEDDVPF
ncbi:single-stranded DNA-binding protein [Candidatus Avelusimicrobium fimicolum]|uniref:single-stranded DNA-binding protein n=1 Tax=Candidatus Avelusimicrobium fimicolum TaxID=3416216 RepID=UPI0015B2F8CB|nr:single-stranded DNA-binding protein [Spirochaetia bacterium]